GHARDDEQAQRAKRRKCVLRNGRALPLLSGHAVATDAALDLLRTGSREATRTNKQEKPDQQGAERSHGKTSQRDLHAATYSTTLFVSSHLTSPPALLQVLAKDNVDKMRQNPLKTNPTPEARHCQSLAFSRSQPPTQPPPPQHATIPP